MQYVLRPSRSKAELRGYAYCLLRRVRNTHSTGLATAVYMMGIIAPGIDLGEL